MPQFLLSCMVVFWTLIEIKHVEYPFWEGLWAPDLESEELILSLIDREHLVNAFSSWSKSFLL